VSGKRPGYTFFVLAGVADEDVIDHARLQAEA
jgi:hypothetical protein